MSEAITKAQPSADFNGDWLLREVRFNAQGAVVDWRLPAQPAPSPQPAAPVVSNEQIDPLVQKHARATWSGSQQDWDVVEFSRLGLVMFANAILALRPAVEPMTPFTPAQRMRLWQNTEKGKSATSLGAFERICQTVEAAHRIGITAKEEDAHQPTKEAE